MRLSVTLFTSVILCSVGSPTAKSQRSPAAAPPVSVVRTARAMQEALTAGRAVTITESPLQEAVDLLHTVSGIVIIRDRRIDPSLPITLQNEFRSTRDHLLEVARQLPNTRAAFAETFVYLGPPENAQLLTSLLETCEQQVRDRSTGTHRSQLLRPAPVSWPEAGVPSEYLQQSATDSETSISGTALLPHDVWPAADWGWMNLHTLAVLTAIQFDRTVTFDESGFRVVPLGEPSDYFVARRHRLPASGTDAIRSLWETEFPGLKVRWTGNTATVEALVETHERLAATIRGESPAGDQMQQPLASRLMTLSTRDTSFLTLIRSFRASGIPVEFRPPDADLNAALQQTTDIDLERVPAEAFFRQVFEALPVTVTLENETVILTVSDETRSD